MFLPFDLIIYFIVVLLTIIYFVSSICYLKQKSKRAVTIYPKIFLLKKWLFITGIIFLNASIAVLFYLSRDVQFLGLLFLLTRVRDIISSTLRMFFSLYNLIFDAYTPLIENKNIVSIVPVYSETITQVKGTLDSLILNKESSNMIICIIIDGGKVDLNEILISKLTQQQMSYESWKGIKNNLNVCLGFYNETPVVILKKVINCGKKDSLILAFDMFSFPRKNLPGINLILRNELKDAIQQIFSNSSLFEYIFFTDADSIISKKSFSYMIDTLDKRKALACCGIVMGAFENGLDIWVSAQNYQYIYGQYMRRSFENYFGTVSCLPGCITMFKVHEISSGAMELYSSNPVQNDFLSSIVQNLGTDRRLTHSHLVQSSGIKTVMEYKALCYTVPPTTIYTYITQRRRWASNAYFNAIINVVAKNIHIVVRIFSSIEVIKTSFFIFRPYLALLFIYQTITNFNYLFFLIFISSSIYLTLCFAVVCILEFPDKSYLFKLFLGFFTNKFISIFSGTIIINMFWNIGSNFWGANQKDVKKENFLVVNNVVEKYTYSI